MRLHKDEVFHLLDAKKHLLGTVILTDFIGDRVRGHFIPEADFSLYRDLFLEHEEAVNDLFMARVEDLEHEIAALRIRNLITSRLHEEGSCHCEEPEMTKQALALQRLLRSARNDASFGTEKPGSYFVHNP